MSNRICKYSWDSSLRGFLSDKQNCGQNEIFVKINHWLIDCLIVCLGLWSHKLQSDINDIMTPITPFDTYDKYQTIDSMVLWDKVQIVA